MKNRMEPSEVNVDILKSYIRNNFVVKSISVWLAKIKTERKIFIYLGMLLPIHRHFLKGIILLVKIV